MSVRYESRGGDGVTAFFLIETTAGWYKSIESDFNASTSVPQDWTLGVADLSWVAFSEFGVTGGAVAADITDIQSAGVYFAAVNTSANFFGTKVEYVEVTASGVPVVVVPPYETWAESYDLFGDNADEKADVEYGGLGDGLENLMEYALGGNPTNDDAAAVSPDTFVADAGGTNWFYHVHNQNTDASLTITVGATTNLVATAADTNDVEFVGATAETNGFKTVTNRTEATSSAKFIKLEVSK